METQRVWNPSLKPDGVYATVGGHLLKLLRVALTGLPVFREQGKKLRVIGLEANRDLIYFNELFESGRFKPVIDSEFGFTEGEVRNAFHHFGAAAHKGKVVVRI